jgi:hypothetical protein
MFVVSEVITTVPMKSIIFWDITPRNPLEARWRFGKTYWCHLLYRRVRKDCSVLVSCLVYSCTLKLDEVRFSEGSMNFNQTIRCYIPEDSIFQYYGFPNWRAVVILTSPMEFEVSSTYKQKTSHWITFWSNSIQFTCLKLISSHLPRSHN